MNLPDARLFHNRYVVAQPFPHMVFKDDFFGFPLKYFRETEFIDWLQTLTGYRNLKYRKGSKKKIDVLFCLDDGDLELRHLRKKAHVKKAHSYIGTLIIFDTSLPHVLKCSSKTHRKSYYQERVVNEAIR